MININIIIDSITGINVCILSGMITSDYFYILMDFVILFGSIECKSINQSI